MTVTNPLVDTLTDAEILEIAISRGLKLAASKEKVEPKVKTPEEIKAELVAFLGETIQTKEEVDAMDDAGKAEVERKAYILEQVLHKFTTASRKVEVKAPVEGKKRGPKSKAEKEAEAKAEKEKADAEGKTDTPEAPADAAPEHQG